MNITSPTKEIYLSVPASRENATWGTRGRDKLTSDGKIIHPRREYYTDVQIDTDGTIRKGGAQ